MQPGGGRPAKPTAGKLDALTVGITADRRADDQAVMFAKLGATALLGRTISTSVLAESSTLRERSPALIAEPPDYLIADTGIGIRAWLEAAAEWGIREQLVDALRYSRIAARGPKASGALSSAGLKAWWRSPTEQLGELVEHLISDGLAGARIFFQLHGEDSAQVVGRLEEAGASVTTLPVYRWGPPQTPGPARELVRRCVEGSLDAITFTAGPQVDGLMAIAAQSASTSSLLEAVSEHRVVVGCIGPVCAEAAQRQGFGDLVVPGAWRLGSLVKAVADALTERR